MTPGVSGKKITTTGDVILPMTSCTMNTPPKIEKEAHIGTKMMSEEADQAATLFRPHRAAYRQPRIQRKLKDR